MGWKKATALLLCLGLGAASMEAMAANVIYRWVGEDGVVHFGNRPPTGVEATVIDSRISSNPTAPAAAESAAPGAESTEGEEVINVAEQRRRERDERRKEYSEKQRRLEGECEIMRRQRDWVEPGPRVLVQGDDGNPRRLDDEEREQLLNEAATFIAENCE